MKKRRSWLDGLFGRHQPTLPREEEAPGRSPAQKPAENAAAVSSARFHMGVSAPVWNCGDVILGLYRVDHVHAGGNMGLVYRAHHLSWDMDLAIKSPRPELFQSDNQKS